MTQEKKISVLVVDDSTVVRGLLRRIIERESDMDVVGSAYDGVDAVQQYKSFRPSIVLMDIEMPNMDGLEAVKQIINFDKNARIIMCSSLTKSGASVTFDSLNAGALDYLAKPSSRAIDGSEHFEKELVQKIRTYGDSKFQIKPSVRDRGMCTSSFLPSDKKVQTNCKAIPASLGFQFPGALVLGASTGGPSALVDVLKDVDPGIGVPIFVTQHIPKGFSKYLAETIESKTPFMATEAEDGMQVQKKCVYLAPGGVHMGVEGGVEKTIKLIDTPPENFCKPAIDVMLRSLAEAYNGNLLNVFLTGMGADGFLGMQEIQEKYKNIILIAQDKESSVVWGIPGKVVEEGLCHAVLPLNDIAAAINALVFKKAL